MNDEFLEGLVLEGFKSAFVNAWRIDRGVWHDPEYCSAEFRQFCEDKATRLLSLLIDPESE